MDETVITTILNDDYFIKHKHEQLPNGDKYNLVRVSVALHFDAVL